MANHWTDVVKEMGTQEIKEIPGEWTDDQRDRNVKEAPPTDSNGGSSEDEEA